MPRGRPKSKVASFQFSNFWDAFQRLLRYGGHISSGTKKYDQEGAVGLLKSLSPTPTGRVRSKAKKFNPDKSWTWELKV